MLKNGRRLFEAWSNKKQHVAADTTMNNLLSCKQVNSKKFLNREENLINLIAAKLLSESIELAKAPYTDEVCDFRADLRFLVIFKDLIF